MRIQTIEHRAQGRLGEEDSDLAGHCGGVAASVAPRRQHEMKRLLNELRPDEAEVPRSKRKRF